VWDTAQGDLPIHILRHGKPLEEISERNREKDDTGVKFTAWGETSDRFYSGSSDGRVKVWNVRRAGKAALIRDLLEVPAAVSYGIFSPDQSKLVVGDASGRVFLLSMDETDKKPDRFAHLQLPGTHRLLNTRRPTPLIPHPEPDPPAVNGKPKPSSGRERAAVYLARRQLQLHTNPTIGAIQGPKYAETGLFRAEAHSNDKPMDPLLAQFESQQQESLKMFQPVRRAMFLPIRPMQDSREARALHRANLAEDLDISSLSDETRLELLIAGVDLDEVGLPYDFVYEDIIPDPYMS
jgi:hypothetical protein